MFFGDVHTHSLCSPDGKYTMLEMARAARRNGVNYLCLTDHCDLLDLNGAFTPDYDFGPCQAAFAQAQEQLPEGLRLRRGVELGEAYEDPDTARKILASDPALDFVIGSVHNFHAMMDKQDFYNADYRDPEMCRAALDDYLDSMLALADLPDCYDTLAHILYPLRYMRKAGQDVSFARGDYPDRLAVILRKVADHGKALELNTWRGRTVDEWAPILRQFKVLGGEYVTVGSDSHDLEHIGAGVRETYELMRACGYRYTAVYENRKPVMEAI